MRTTVELPHEQYVALRELAARRGLRGFSPLIAEAIALLLERQDDAAVDGALELAAVLDDREADALEARVSDLRSRPARGEADAGSQVA